MEGGRYIGGREIYWREGDTLEGERYIGGREIHLRKRNTLEEGRYIGGEAVRYFRGRKIHGRQAKEVPQAGETEAEEERVEEQGESGGRKEGIIFIK